MNLAESISALSVCSYRRTFCLPI